MANSGPGKINEGETIMGLDRCCQALVYVGADSRFLSELHREAWSGSTLAHPHGQNTQNPPIKLDADTSNRMSNDCCHWLPKQSWCPKRKHECPAKQRCDDQVDHQIQGKARDPVE